MDRHLAVIVLVIVVVASTGMTLSTTTSSNAQPKDDDSSMGNAVSSFMQVSVAEADSTVNREMWEASFENADSESEKAALLKQRSNQLSQELSSIQKQQQQLNGSTEHIAHARTTALNAQVIELRESIGNVSQTANESNVSDPKLSTLRTKACTVNVSNDSSIVDPTRDGAGLCPPNRSDRNSSDRTVGNDTQATPGAGNRTPENNTGVAPGAGNQTLENDTQTTPRAGNQTDQPQAPQTGTQTETGTTNPDTKTGTESENETGPSTGTTTPPTSVPTPNSTDTPNETLPTTGENNNTNTIEILAKKPMLPSPA